MKQYLLYNSKSNSGKIYFKGVDINNIENTDILEKIDVLTIHNYKVFIEGLEKDSEIIICGGDGTLNNFIKRIENFIPTQNVYYYPSGTGNDFYKSLKEKEEFDLIQINDYLKKLPSVTINDKAHLFINGVGFGIDGYCCEKGDELREKNVENINYTSIAIKGLLFYYKPTNVTITVDGKEYKFKKAWLAPVMYGKYYGGGMIPCPEQERDGENLSVMVFHGSGRLKTLMIFPSIFKGEHVKHDKYVKVFKGKEITVTYDEPRTAQVDGETILNVKSITARI